MKDPRTIRRDGNCTVCAMGRVAVKAVATISMQRDCPHCRELGKQEGLIVTADACQRHLDEAYADQQACEHGTPIHFSEPIKLL